MTRFGVQVGIAALLGAALVSGCTASTDAPRPTSPITADAVESEAASADPGAAGTPAGQQPPVGGVTFSPSPSARASTSEDRFTSNLRGALEGYITGVDAQGRASVDVVTYATGAEAVKLAAATPKYWGLMMCKNGPAGAYEGGPTTGCILPAGHLIINDNETIQPVPLADGVQVSLVDPKACCDAKPSDRAQLAARSAKGRVLAHLKVDDSGRITSVEEIYVS